MRWPLKQKPRPFEADTALATAPLWFIVVQQNQFVKTATATAPVGYIVVQQNHHKLQSYMPRLFIFEGTAAEISDWADHYATTKYKEDTSAARISATEPSFFVQQPGERLQQLTGSSSGPQQQQPVKGSSRHILTNPAATRANHCSDSA